MKGWRNEGMDGEMDGGMEGGMEGEPGSVMWSMEYLVVKDELVGNC